MRKKSLENNLMGKKLKTINTQWKKAQKYECEDMYTLLLI